MRNVVELHIVAPNVPRQEHGNRSPGAIGMSCDAVYDARSLQRTFQSDAATKQFQRLVDAGRLSAMGVALSEETPKRVPSIANDLESGSSSSRSMPAAAAHRRSCLLSWLDTFAQRRGMFMT
mmetsp:Transcript_57884/g.132962  ORF Transcript_57884/g.132962 Transcript_57884/m.132962 type:complete len:122 (-) Transcript_57884:241-606(-)